MKVGYGWPLRVSFISNPKLLINSQLDSTTESINNLAAFFCFFSLAAIWKEKKFAKTIKGYPI